MAAALAALSGGPAVAQETDPVIVVDGSREKPPSTTRSVRAIAQSTDGGLARFETPVCPAVGGFPINFATTVLGLMRDATRSAGVELAPEECRANLTLLVTDDGRALIDGLSRKRPEIFMNLSASDLGKLRREAGPAWSWHSISPRRADGAPVVRDGGGGSQTYVVRGAKMSRLSSPVRQDVGAAFVILDVAAIEGLTLQQIADFAVMRGLAPTRDPHAEDIAFDSILQLFDRGTPVEAMTEFDRKFLSALYSGGNGFTYSQKTRQIAQRVDRPGDPEED